MEEKTTLIDERTIFALLRNALGSKQNRKGLWLAIGVLLVTWLGVNAVWGLTSPEDTLISAWEKQLASRPIWIGATSVLLLTFGVFAAVGRKQAILVFIAVLFAYLIGVVVSRLAYSAVDPQFSVPLESAGDFMDYFWQRSFFLMPALPMLVVYFFLKGHADRQLLPWGNWQGSTRLFFENETKQSWRKQLVRWLLFIALPFALLMQISAGFAPIVSGKLFIFFIPIVLMALFNAFAEELIFRGFIQAGLVDYLGPGLGLWLQGLYFGIHHWGASPDLIAGLPPALIVGFFGVVWGKSVLETNGLGWAIACHMFFDVAFFSVQFVAPVHVG
ncbi:CPBP family intramembrane metalloprotease [candidate division KSB1 bacterium]|nr:CPBP family intramembrane metalloprotease [candidate division KSB1 bacterium]NIR68921.1 CPBP family intramembrane metalloprotease [candidate division KSB1 bacterium]NIS22575.1 CPBP family intramembrane metalloprotease [candidate division KSB1 bacterium]NIT69423.1 CPBP family intramembrane metalloprotease [candidate division KSB1 bacterium]NIU23078.1 CPBP family intramembrane metalloprotease [candidate division KSB1 bacterium]